MTRAPVRGPQSPNAGNNKQKRSPQGRLKAAAKKNSENQADWLRRVDDTTQMFPRFTPLLVAVTLWAIRVMYVLNPRNWWMVHPDEVYQSVEVPGFNIHSPECLKKKEKKSVDINGGESENGKKVFVTRCQQCQPVEAVGKHKTRPNLSCLFGRKTGQAPGFVYTEANKNKGITWTRQTLFEYLDIPKKYIPGTKMVFADLRNEQERVELVAYLEQAIKK